MSQKIIEKKQKRAGLVNQMRSLLNKAEKETKGVLSADDEKKYVDMEAEVDSLGKEIDREDKLGQVENTLRQRKDHDYRPGASLRKDGEGKRNASEYRDAMFGHFARFGKTGLSHEHLNVLTEGADTEGGYLVPEEFETQMTENLVTADPIRAAATVITTATDRNIPIEDGVGSFGYIGEKGTYGNSDPSVGRVVLGAHKCGGIIKVSEELLQDSAFGIEAYLQRLAGRRYNTLEQTSFANGDGNAKPLGLFQTTAVGTTAVTGTTGAVSATPAITGDNLIDTFHGLGRSYRDRSSWLTSDAMVKMIRKLKGEDNQYLWQPGLVAGQPDRLLNRPIFVSDGAPVPAVASRSLLLGDWSFYYIVDRLGLSMQVLKELYAAEGQVGFKFTKRHDGRMTFAPAMTFFAHGAAA